MNFDFSCYNYSREDKINEKNAWEVIAKRNNPNFVIPKRYFAIRHYTSKLDCIGPANLIPVDTEEGYRFYNDCILVPFEMYGEWIKYHPNQRIVNDFTLKCALEQGVVSKEFYNELQEKGLIVEPPKELKEKML